MVAVIPVRGVSDGSISALGTLMANGMEQNEAMAAGRTIHEWDMFLTSTISKEG